MIGSPKYVGDTFVCSDNSLVSLVGGPQEVGYGYYCSNNKLTTLEGCPGEIKGGLSFWNNNIASLITLPKEVAEHTQCSCHDNPLPPKIITILDNVLKKDNNQEILFKNMHDYGIWNPDGSFNEKRFDMFKRDLDNGVLS